ncbi:MAG: 3-methyl-2-oxobutanoate hydroxymethyltransferase [Actinobacteria bacterium]|nr:3-methyl-2-oxobutanoate hydroxymethyltransferase [Actinomycetota bacterium]
MKRLSARDILELKGKRKITKTTALDFFTARAIEQAEIDIIGLDGPPTEIYYKGMQNGIKAKLYELIFCLKAVRRGAPNTFIMVPIPYGYSYLSYEKTSEAVVKLIKTGADAVKIEGAGINVEKIKRIANKGIPCVGTVGLNMEIVIREGFKSIGKKADEAVETYKNALALQEAGVIWLELECVPYKVTAEITKRLKVPAIGVGSGAGCDGQFLHCEDILGMHDRYYPKHCKKYLNFFKDSVTALKRFKEEVKIGIFPEESNSFEIDDKEFEAFLKRID